VRKRFFLRFSSLGFTIEDTALVNSAVPLADIFGPPAAGLLADKLGNFAVFMGVVTALNGAASLALLLIPRVDMQERN
jgi:MFS family permease